MEIDISSLKRGPSPADLLEKDIHISNITATVDIEGEFDREELAADLPNSEYDPEKHRSLIFRSSNVNGIVVLIPRTGRASITGAQSSEGLIQGVEDFISAVSKIGIERKYTDIRIENVVATIDLGNSIDLSNLVIELGLESAEYEPEQFPGVIYRPNNGPVILIYSSGKAIITKTRTYEEVLTTYQNLQEQIESVFAV